ncbi:MAG TPA: HK97 family phage prohead protease [Planctomycetaceae bacterium]|nr:HK97 family phage prohead protease [Planctomycetaceae bacterium]
MKSLCHRFNPSDVEARSVEGSQDLPPISGLAAVYFNSTDPDRTEYRIRKDVVERIQPGVFDPYISGDVEILALRDHDEGLFLGRRSSGTLSVSLTDRGMEYKIQTPDTVQGRDTLALIQRRDISGSSFSMLRPKPQWSYEMRATGKTYVRTVGAIEGIHDLGPVLYPAYSGTSASIGARSCGITSLSRSAGPPAEVAEIETELTEFINVNWHQSEAELRLRQLAFRR